MDVDVDALQAFLLEVERPVRITELAEVAVRRWLASQGRKRRYAPGSSYRVGEQVLFRGQVATVVGVGSGDNPKQGQFQIVSLDLGAGCEKHMAAGVRGADTDDTVEASDKDVRELLEEGGLAIRHAVRAALEEDGRFVWVPDEQSGQWYLASGLEDISSEDVAKVVELLAQAVAEDVPVPVTTAALLEELRGVEDDGSNAYRRSVFRLEATLQRYREFEHIPGEGWLFAEVWRRFSQREEFRSPQQPNIVPPAAVAVDEEADETEEDEQRQTAEGAVEPSVEQLPHDFIAWQENRLLNAEFVLYAKHYYHSWLPLNNRMRRLFPPKKSQVIFYHRFGGEEQSFSAILDPEQGRILGGEAMYAALYDNAIYPGARLIVSHRGNLNEYDIRTKPVADGQTIEVRRLELLDDGTLEDWIEIEPMRYEVDKYVVVGEVRWEDVPALFRQADEVGVGVFTLIYHRCSQWQEARGEPLQVTADELYNAIHFDVKAGRPTTMASISWELWRRLAFENYGNGRHLFRPEYGAEIRSTISSSRPTRVEPLVGSRIRKDRTLTHTISRDTSDFSREMVLAAAVSNYKRDAERPKILFLRSVAHEQIHQLLIKERIDGLTLAEFNEHVWQIGSIRYRDQEARIDTDDASRLLQSMTTGGLRNAYEAGALEIVGNQTWGSATHVFGAALSLSEEEKEKTLRETLRYLLYGSDSTEERLHRVLNESNGFGMNVATGVLHAVFPDRHILYNSQSVTALNALGHKWLRNWQHKAEGYFSFREMAVHLKEEYELESFSDVDWFLYNLAKGQLTLPREEASSENALAHAPGHRPTRFRQASSYFIFQQKPATDSEYADRIGKIYNWREGIPGSRQIEEGARFVYYRPGEQVFFGTGCVQTITSYRDESGLLNYDGHLADYEPWEPPLKLDARLGRALSFVQPERLGVGQAGIRKISRADFDAIVSANEKWRERSGGSLLGTGRSSADAFWRLLQELEGRILRTPGQGQPFRIVAVHDSGVDIRVLSSGKAHTVYRTELERASSEIWYQDGSQRTPEDRNPSESSTRNEGSG